MCGRGASRLAAVSPDWVQVVAPLLLGCGLGGLLVAYERPIARLWLNRTPTDRGEAVVRGLGLGILIGGVVGAVMGLLFPNN